VKFEFSGQISEKYANIKFRENPSSGIRVAFRYFANAPKKQPVLLYILHYFLIRNIYVIKLCFCPTVPILPSRHRSIWLVYTLHFSIILIVGLYASVYQECVHKFYRNVGDSSELKAPGKDMN